MARPCLRGKQSDVKKIAVLSNAIPDAWFEGLDVALVRDAPTDAPVPLRAGMCGYLAFLPGVLKQVDGLVLSTCCDQMRRAAEWLAADECVFLFNVPSTHHQERLLQSEKARLMKWLAQLPQARSRLKRCDASPSDARTQGAQDARPIGTDMLSIGVLGGHFCGDQDTVKAFFAKRGIQVALWGCEGGEWVGDVFQRPNAAFYDQVQAVVTKRHLQGLVVVRTTWCDVWRLACVRLHEVLQVPVLEWVMDGQSHGQSSLDGSSVTRLEAFCELLRGRREEGR